MNIEERVKEIDELFNQVRKNTKQLSSKDVQLIKEKENQLDVLMKELDIIKSNPSIDIYLKHIVSLLYDEIKIVKNFDLKQLREESEEE